MINLKLINNFGKFDCNKFSVFNEGDLDIRLQCEDIYNSQIEVIVNNGESEKRFIAKNKTFTIYKDFLKLGKISIKINILLNRIVVKSYKCEDLYIVDDSEKVQGIPEIDKLYTQMNELKREVQDYKLQTQVQLQKLNSLVNALYGIKR